MNSIEHSELVRIIRKEIAQAMNVILFGSTSGTTKNAESVDNIYPGQTTLTDRPMIMPYGHVGRAPVGTLNLTARSGDHAGARIIIGHWDSDRPDVEEGEASLYSAEGFQTQAQKAGVKVGKGSDMEFAVVGDTLRAFLTTLLQDIVQHTHAAPGAPPTNAAAFVTLGADNLDNDKILAKDGGRF